MGKLLGNTRRKVLLRDSLGLVGPIRKPYVDGKVGKPRIDIDGDIRKQQVILRLCYLAARVIDFDSGLAFQRRLAHLPQLAREPAMCSQVIVFLLNIDGGAETGMGYGAVVTLQVVFQHRLPVGAGVPGFSAVQLETFQVDAATCKNLEQLAEVRGERLCVGVNIDKDKRAQGLHPNRQQWIVFQSKVGLSRGARRTLQATVE